MHVFATTRRLRGKIRKYTRFIVTYPPYRIVVACEVEKFPVAETKISAHDYPEYSPQGLAAG